MSSGAVAIITARGGSKRIPRKNVRPFLGRPIIAYSIEAALKSGSFSEVMVSTDDAEIAEIARGLGARIPFMRSEKNSNDLATTADVIREVLDQYRESGRDFERFCCLYPTAPFVTAARLQEAMGLLGLAGVDAAVPVTRFSYPIQRALQIRDGKLSMVEPRYLSTRSQDLEPRYHDCGQFYCGKTEPFRKTHSVFPPNTCAVIVPELEVQDIDTEEDWKIAELKFQFLHSKNIYS